MDLSTEYLGLQLPHPFIVGASPLGEDLDMVKRLEDAGAAAIVLSSLFEEQLVGEQLFSHFALDLPAESFAEAQSYLPRQESLTLGPDDYLEHLRRVKKAVDIPVLASLNGTSDGGWLEYSKLLEEAGADAIELNVYLIETDPQETAEGVEKRILNMARIVLSAVQIPVAVKLSPFYTALANLARQLDSAGIHGLILFNRFYQPDVDPENLEIVPHLKLSSSSELLLRVHWLAILSGWIRASLAVTGGVHTPVDAIKAVMAGASAVQMVSALLQKGPAHLMAVREGVTKWMEEHEYVSLTEMRGSMNLQHCPDPAALERLNYARILKGWRDFL